MITFHNTMRLISGLLLVFVPQALAANNAVEVNLDVLDLLEAPERRIQPSYPGLPIHQHYLQEFEREVLRAPVLIEEVEPKVTASILPAPKPNIKTKAPVKSIRVAKFPPLPSPRPKPGPPEGAEITHASETPRVSAQAVQAQKVTEETEKIVSAVFTKPVAALSQEVLQSGEVTDIQENITPPPLDALVSIMDLDVEDENVEQSSKPQEKNAHREQEQNAPQNGRVQWNKSEEEREIVFPAKLALADIQPKAGQHMKDIEVLAAVPTLSKASVAERSGNREAEDTGEVESKSRLLDRGGNKWSLSYAYGEVNASEPVLSALTDRLNRALAQSDVSRVEIRAYALSNGDGVTEARRLSLNRALKIRESLIANDIPPYRIDIKALGEQSPDGPVDRADIVIVE